MALCVKVDGSAKSRIHGMHHFDRREKSRAFRMLEGKNVTSQNVGVFQVRMIVRMESWRERVGVGGEDVGTKTTTGYLTGSHCHNIKDRPWTADSVSNRHILMNEGGCVRSG